MLLWTCVSHCWRQIRVISVPTLCNPSCGISLFALALSWLISPPTSAVQSAPLYLPGRSGV